jgi:hypothetical protein
MSKPKVFFDIVVISLSTLKKNSKSGFLFERLIIYININININYISKKL